MNTCIVNTACMLLLFVSVVAAVEWKKGRATWYNHPGQGSCGYGKLQGVEGYKANFGIDSVAALPDVHPDFRGSCGLCYEVKCRGIRAISSSGQVNLPREDACYNESMSIIVKVVDTCPCSGNEEWCCGDMDHLDLSEQAFGRLADPGKGIIGLSYRSVPCVAKFRELVDSDWKLWEENFQELGANPKVFVQGKIGLGWQKTVYSNEKNSIKTYHPNLVDLPGGSKALCANIFTYGGFHFRSQKPKIQNMMQKAKRVEFLARSDGNMADVAFMVNNNDGIGCWDSRTKLPRAQKIERAEGGWEKFSFDMSAFTCNDVSREDLNRLHFENLGSETANICIKDLELVL